MADEFCPECGAKITGKTGFCSECGAVTTSLQNSINEAKKTEIVAKKRKVEKQKQNREELIKKIKKNKYWIILGLILLIFLINFNTILAIMFPQDTSVNIYAEESPYIRGGIIHFSLEDITGNEIKSDKMLNVTIIDDDGHKGSGQVSAHDSLYKGNYNDNHWNKLNDYGNFTVIAQYSGELGYNPCNVTKNITINFKEVPK